MNWDAQSIATLVPSLVSIIGAVAAFLKHKEITNYLLLRKKIKLEKKRTKLEAIQAGRAQQNYYRFLKIKNITPQEALEALRETNKTIVKITEKIDEFNQEFLDNKKEPEAKKTNQKLEDNEVKLKDKK